MHRSSSNQHERVFECCLNHVNKYSDDHLLIYLRLGMGRVKTDPNESISCFGLESTRTESQESESFNFDSDRFQLTSNSAEISKKDIFEMRS